MFVMPVVKVRKRIRDYSTKKSGLSNWKSEFINPLDIHGAMMLG